jgi:hypothetical protein
MKGRMPSFARKNIGWKDDAPSMHPSKKKKTLKWASTLALGLGIGS